MRHSVREQQIPFAISRNILNAVTLEAMDSAEKEKEFVSVKNKFYMDNDSPERVVDRIIAGYEVK